MLVRYPRDLVVNGVNTRLSRAAVTAAMRGISAGRIDVLEGGRMRTYGRPGAGLHAQLTINDPGAWNGPIRGSLGLGEGYVDGLWETDDLVSLLRIAARELRRLEGIGSVLARPRAWIHRLRGLVPENTRTRARANISAHYDLGNELFGAFLDPSMTYSCAYFADGIADLEEAQTAKLDRICQKLRLAPGDRLLEIGTGWGGLAVHAASHYGCRVTTTTISRRQHALAAERVRAAGLEDRVTLLMEDYRDLRGRYDKLVSIEMIEAVGWQYLDSFFDRCSELLEPDGLMLLQAIVIDDRLYEVEKAARSFANTHIFPGGCLPSNAQIADCVARMTDLRAIWMEDITDHYPRTLQAWRERFLAAWEDLRGRGYDERFRRLWTFYLSSSEAGFRERRIGDVQVLLAKPGWRQEDAGTEADRGAFRQLQVA